MAPAHLTDTELVSRCREGDLEAFGAVYARYARPVYRFCRHMLDDDDDADDVKQDTFLKAYHALPAFRGECGLLTWLLKISKNLCRDRIKSQMRRAETELMPAIEDGLADSGRLGMDPAKIFERKDLYALALRSLQRLPESQRALIILRDIEGLSYQQIAEVLGCSVAGVKLRLFRARRSLKDRMESLLMIR